MPLVVIEGLSGVGKSSLAPRLAVELGAIYYPSIPPELGPARSFVDSQQDVEARHLYLFECSRSDEFSAKRTPGKG
jgi:MoxR-like ATPase